MGRKKPIFHTNLHVPIEALRIFAKHFYYKLPKLYVVEDMSPEPLFGLLTRTYQKMITSSTYTVKQRRLSLHRQP